MNWHLFDARPGDWFRRHGFPAALFSTFFFLAPINSLGGNETSELSPRPPWTTSRVIGSPEPPPPYTVEPVFTQIGWKNPIFAIREPGSDWLIVVEWPQPRAAATESDPQDDSGKPASPFAPARAVRVLDRAGEEHLAPFLELEGRAIYCIEFHPRYRENGQIYVCSKTHPEGGGVNILSRLVVPRPAETGHDNRPVCDPASETRILEWPSNGHDGGAVVFGHDGMLYVSIGDGTSDSDEKLTAQDASSLLGKILRIDVDRPSQGLPYGIPSDNPFLDVRGARGEIWSLGHRNPWRMTVDERTGGLWVGNNGQDLWEFAHLVKRGDNCGWSVYEGSHPFYLNRQLGPGKFAPPTVEHDHGKFRSLTGGVVYYGQNLPSLDGVYVYGDYSTGAIWGVKHDGEKVVWNREMARTTLDIVGFATSAREDLLVLDHASGIYRLVESPPDDSYLRFPRRLSETGVLASAATHEPALGVVPYVVAAPGWMDGATAERFVALPDTSSIQRVSPNQWEFPDGAVLLQTFSMPQSNIDGHTAPRIETRLLTKQAGVWAAYSYVWNSAQDDAFLAPAEGMKVRLSDFGASSGDGKSSAKTWNVPSRADCMSCHSRAANFVLGLNDLQADCDVTHGDDQMNQLRVFNQRKLVDTTIPSRPAEAVRLLDPYDTSHDLEARTRSYLHVNCSVCHVSAGGGNSRMLLNLAQKREEMQLVEVFPQHQSFGLPLAMLVAPGHPERSILHHRMSRRGAGQMPPRGSHVVDQVGVQLIRDWIAQLQPQRPFVKEWTIDDLAPDLEKLNGGRQYEKGSRLFTELGCLQCHRFAQGGGGAGPDLSGVSKKRSPRELLESILEPSKQIAPEFAATILITITGKTLEGRVSEDDNQKLILHTADALAEPLVLSKEDIDERHLSTTSTMPEGLLDRLQKPEILDLLAYLLADGESKHAIYSN